MTNNQDKNVKVKYPLADIEKMVTNILILILNQKYQTKHLAREICKSGEEFAELPSGPWGSM